jgi:hypothetical protein
MAARLGLDRAEYVGRATAFIFVVSSGFPPRNGGRKGTHIGMQRDRFLVQADDRLLWIVGLFIGLQNVILRM